MTHEQELEGYILQGMARAIWVHAFIQWATTVDPPPEFPPNSDWADVTPPTPPGALKAAKDFAHGIRESNHLRMYPMGQMFLATRRYAQPTRSSTRATEADHAFQFGEDVAQACLGTLGVPELGQYKIPEMTVTLDDDGRSLSWDEGWFWQPIQPNPARWPNSDVQSLLFDKNQYSVRRAQRWAQEHGFKYGSVDEGHVDFIHLRQFEHRTGQPCATVDFGHGIEAVVCATRNPSKGAPEILIVEADPDEQTAAIRLLKKVFGTKPRFIIADNVNAAIGDLEVHEFMLIVSDVPLLGTKTGVDLFQYVQQNYPHLVDRFMFLTDDEAARRVHGRYVAKTGTADDVKRAIRAPASRTTTSGPLPATLSVMSLNDIAQAVKGVLPAIQERQGPSGMPMGRFGDGVFIAAVWRALQRTPGFRAMTMAQFKRRLVEANRDRLLDLGRLDAQGDVDPEELEESEIVDLGARFHVVKDRSNTAKRRAPEGMTVLQFGQAVNDLATKVTGTPGPSGRPTGRFGDRKVFVAAIWRLAQRDPRFAGVALDDFKRMLLRAQRDGVIDMARADLVGAMDPDEVAESETRESVGQGFPIEFHFVIDPRYRA